MKTRRFRFSLLTLLIVALLCGCGMLLWRKHEPWAVRLTIRETTTIHAADFSPLDNYVYTCIYTNNENGQPESEWRETMHIYERETGRLIRTLTSAVKKSTDSYGSFSFSPAEHYVLRFSILKETKAGTGPQMSSQEIWRDEDGQSISLKPDESFQQFSPLDTFASFEKASNESCVRRLPSLQEFRQLGECERLAFSPDEKWFVVYRPHCTGPIELISTDSGEKRALSKSVENCYCWFSQDSKILIAECVEKIASPIHVFEVKSGNWLGEYKGRQGRLSDDGRFLITYVRDKSESVSSRESDAFIWDLSTKGLRMSVHLSSNTEGIRIHGNHVLAEYPLRVYDLDTGGLLWKSILRYGDYSPNGEYAFDHEFSSDLSTGAKTGTLGILIDVATGKRLQEFTLPREQYERFGLYFNLTFAGTHREFLTRFARSDEKFRNRQVQLWHRRRPEAWWGYAWLPEFWLSVVVAGMLLCSIVRDRRSL